MRRRLTVNARPTTCARFVCSLALMGATLSGCRGSSSQRESVRPPSTVTLADTQPFNLISALAELQRELVQPGTGEQTALRSKARALFERKHVLAEFAEIYAATALPARWYLLQLAGFAMLPDTVAFLAEVARAQPLRRETTATPLSIASADSHQHYHSAGSDVVDDTRNRLAAARGVAAAAVQNVPGAVAEADSLLAQAEAGVAQWVGVELFTHNSFGAGQRSLLQQRGIGTEFRAMSDEEWRRLLVAERGVANEMNAQQKTVQFKPQAALE